MTNKKLLLHLLLLLNEKSAATIIGDWCYIHELDRKVYEMDKLFSNKKFKFSSKWIDPDIYLSNTPVTLNKLYLENDPELPDTFMISFELLNESLEQIVPDDFLTCANFDEK